MYLHHHFAIDLAVGTFYATCAFLVASRVKLRLLDAKHAREGLTNGWQRLRWKMHDGDDQVGLGSLSSRNTSSSSLEQPRRNGYTALRDSSPHEQIEVAQLGQRDEVAEARILAEKV